MGMAGKDNLKPFVKGDSRINRKGAGHQNYQKALIRKKLLKTAMESAITLTDEELKNNKDLRKLSKKVPGLLEIGEITFEELILARQISDAIYSRNNSSAARLILKYFYGDSKEFAKTGAGLIEFEDVEKDDEGGDVKIEIIFDGGPMPRKIESEDEMEEYMRMWEKRVLGDEVDINNDESGKKDKFQYDL